MVIFNNLVIGNYIVIFIFDDLGMCNFSNSCMDDISIDFFIGLVGEILGCINFNVYNYNFSVMLDNGFCIICFDGF